MTQEEAKKVMAAIGPNLHGEWCELCLTGILRNLALGLPGVDWDRATIDAQKEDGHEACQCWKGPHERPKV